MGAIVNRSSSDGRSGGTAVATPRRKSASRAPATPFASALEHLSNVTPGTHRVVTCYLKLEPRDRARGKYLIKLKNRIKETEAGLAQLDLDKDQERAAKADLGRILEYLKVPANLPATLGVAIFASESIDLFEVVPLPQVHRSRLAVDRSPLVRELASVEDEIGRLLTVLLDRSSARFFEVSAFEARELPGLTSPHSARGRFRGEGKSQTWGEHTFHNRIRTEKQRHWEAVARRLFELERRTSAHGIVIGAIGTESAAIEPFLHSYVVERVLGTTKLAPRTATAAEVHAATLAVREAWERTSERQLVQEVADGLGAGWAMNGVSESLAALGRGQVRSLLVGADIALPGVRAAETGRLALTAKELDGEGDALPVIDVIDEAIEDGLRQHVDVNVVYDPEAAGRVDGLAALLRFR